MRTLHHSCRRLCTDSKTHSSENLRLWIGLKLQVEDPKKYNYFQKGMRGRGESSMKEKKKEKRKKKKEKRKKRKKRKEKKRKEKKRKEKKRKEKKRNLQQHSMLHIRQTSRAIPCFECRCCMKDCTTVWYSARLRPNPNRGNFEHSTPPNKDKKCFIKKL